MNKNITRGLLLLILAIAPPAMLDAATVAWWKMEPESGEYATDSIGGFQDAVSGTRLYNTNGASGQALSFDGLSTYITRAAANAPSLTGNFSLETWIALQEYPWNWTAIIDRQSNHTSGYLLNVDDVGHLGFSLAAGGNWWSCTTAGADRAYNSILHTNGWNTGSVHTMYRNDGKLQLTVGGNGDFASTANVTAGKWSHIVTTYTTSGTTKRVRFYIDGTLRGSTTTSSTQAGVLGALELGGWDGGGRNFKCYMDDFRLYSRELTATEVTNLNAGSGPTDTIAWWKFDETSGTTAADSTSGTKHNGTLHGCSWLAGKFGNCINMNGVDDYVAVPAIGTYADFSISVWVNFNTGSTALPLQQWQHVIATYDTSAGLSLYLNGTRIAQGTGSGTPVAPTGIDLQIGYGRDKQYPTNTERGPSMIGSPMILSGLLDEVKIYNTALSQTEVTAAYNAATPPVPTPLSYWQMPTGTPTTGEFGASYQKLKYSDQWDSVFRSGEAADVLVKFDQMPVNYVFWKGWNYGLCMITENGLLSCDQSVEWSDGYGCVEHMSDKQDRYSHIDIVENNDARVVLKWRYAPCNIMYGLFNVDPTTGWANWVDEYFYIYPDGVMMREQNTWTTEAVELGYVGGWGGWPSNQETIFFSQPGKRQLDTVNQAAVTLANDAGQSTTYTWWSGMPNQPTTPTIQMVNFKSTYRPYMIRRPGATIASFGPSGYIDPGFPYWDHWPVCQLPNDGRQAPRTDRPAHTSLSWFCEPPISHSGIYYTWTYMYGLTSGTAASLATQSKAWNTPASLTVNTGDFTSQGFITTQKAWQLTSTTPGNPSNLIFTLNGSTSSPILNPAIVIQGWGDTLPNISVNGVATPRSADCRMGINYGLSSNNLVIWLKKSTTAPLTISLATGVAPAQQMVHYRFDETTGTTASDSSGSGNSGSLVNGPTWAAGRVNNCVSLDGVDDYVSVPDLGTSGSFTLSTWLNPASLSKASNAIACCSGWESGDVQACIASAGQLTLSINGAVPSDQSSAYAFNSGDLGRWKHVALVFDGTAKTAKFYINGILNATRTYTSIPSPNFNGVWVGGWSGGDRYFAGKLDEFRIHNYALSDSQVMALASAGAPVVTIGYAKKTDDGEFVTLNNVPVTYAPRDSLLARRTNYFYVEEPKRSSGIRVLDGYAGQDDLNVDLPATLTGILQTDGTTLEKCLVLTTAPTTGTTGSVNPVGLSSHSVLNDTKTVGELVRIAGKVKSVATDQLSFVMSDGGKDVTVVTEMGQPLNSISAGNMIAVNGVISKSDATTRQILLRKLTRLIPPETLLPSLAYYKFDDTSGLTAIDSSDHHYDAALRSTGCTRVSGKLNNAISFSSGYVSCPNLGTGYGKFTIACWLNVAALAQGSGWDATSIVSSDGWSSGCIAFLLLGANNTSNYHPRKLQLSVAGAPGNDLIWSNYQFTDDKLNTWVHVAVVYGNTSGAKFYINGVLDSSATFATSQTATLASVKIGSWETSRYFSGKIDDISFYDRVLTASEIAQLYNGQ